MRFTPDIYDFEVEREFRRFFDWTGETVWKQKLDKLAKSPQYSAAASYREYLTAKNPLTTCVAKYFALGRKGLSIARHLDARTKKLCGYLKLLNRIAHVGREEIVKRLKGSIFDDDSVCAFLFELDLAIHFFMLGYDVEFVDLEGRARYDLLVSDGSQELEVECKRKSIDAGRKIKKGDFYLLADILFGVLSDTSKRFAVLIKSDGRMGADEKLFQTLASTIKDWLGTNTKEGEVGNLNIKIEELPEDHIIRSDAEAKHALQSYYSAPAYYAVFSSAHTTILIRCESVNANKVLDAIYEELKKGASQLSGTKPSLLACFIEEVDDQFWESLGDASGLQAVGIRLLSNPSRSHVNLVTFSSGETPPQRDGNLLRFSALHIRYWNPNPTFPLPRSFFSFSDE